MVSVVQPVLHNEHALLTMDVEVLGVAQLVGLNQDLYLLRVKHEANDMLARGGTVLSGIADELVHLLDPLLCLCYHIP